MPKHRRTASCEQIERREEERRGEIKRDPKVEGRHSDTDGTKVTDGAPYSMKFETPMVHFLIFNVRGHCFNTVVGFPIRRRCEREK